MHQNKYHEGTVLVNRPAFIIYQSFFSYILILFKFSNYANIDYGNVELSLNLLLRSD